MMRTLYAASLVLWIASFAMGQTSSVFDVASVRVSQSQGKPRVETSPGGVTIEGTLSYILGWAYDVKQYQIVGPGWIGMERYRVVAKAASPVALKDLRTMSQALLAERFKLEAHREIKDVSVLALVVAKGGPKLKESESEGESVTTNAKKEGTGGTSVRTSMAQLAALLDGGIGPDPIVDQTGLKGRYDFTLDLARYINGNEKVDWLAVLCEALQKQLGLNLERRKIPIEMLVVDRVQKVPVEN